MSPVDAALWFRWSRIYAREYIGFYFNVRIAGRVDNPPGGQARGIEAHFDNTAFRLDAVGIRPDHYDIIEFRGRAGVGALGAVLAYERLFLREASDFRPTQKIIVTEVLNPELWLIYRQFNVRVDVV